jgi:hypothetical protein
MLEFVVEDRAQLRAKVETLEARNRELTGQVVRIVRREMGMPEEPRKPREAPDPMPPELRAYYDNLWPAAIAKSLRDKAFQRRARGETWLEIAETVLPDEFDHTPDMGNEEEGEYGEESAEAVAGHGQERVLP